MDCLLGPCLGVLLGLSVGPSQVTVSSEGAVDLFAEAPPVPGRSVAELLARAQSLVPMARFRPTLHVGRLPFETLSQRAQGPACPLPGCAPHVGRFSLRAGLSVGYRRGRRNLAILGCFFLLDAYRTPGLEVLPARDMARAMAGVRVGPLDLVLMADLGTSRVSSHATTRPWDYAMRAVIRWALGSSLATDP